MCVRIFIAVASVCLLGCSATQEIGLSAPQGGVRAMRFAVLPVNAVTPVSTELSVATDRVLGQITRYLQVQGRERLTIELPRTQQLWRASIAEVARADSLSNDFDHAIRVFARKLGESIDFDALVLTALVFREARVARRLAKWDGAVRRIRAGGDQSDGVSESFAGTVSAASLHVMVFDTDGELVFSNYGGLDLVHVLRLEPGDEGKLRAELKESVLEEYGALREGVELAFEPYFPRPSSGDW
jgi:hypothetical protein